MPLSEFYRMAKGKLNSSHEEKGPSCSTDNSSFLPEEGTDFVELVWENGQPHGQSSRTTRDPKSSTSAGMDLNQEDDMAPWFNYTIQEQHNDYCDADFLPELSGVTTNHQNRNSFSVLEKRSRTNTYNSILNNGSSLGTRPSSSSSQISCEKSPYVRSRLSDDTSKNTDGKYSQDNNNHGLLNFSHFSRPAVLLKANLQTTISPKTNLGLSSIEKIEKGSLVDSRITNAAEHKTLQQEDVFKDDETVKGVDDSRKAPETAPVVGASSSVCSGNSMERASDDPTYSLKRKGRDAEDSECPSEDADEELSEGGKKSAPARSAGSKRSRVAEVHNMSERRRRDRINEKMHALQELIPNCSKVDKASMLDEAIEYLKTLQLQVQIMSMGAGLYMPPMMGMHPYSSMGHVGMGMGMSMGFGMGAMAADMNSRSVPLMYGTQFPGPQMPMPGMAAAGSNLHPFGLGIPLSMRHHQQPLFPHIMNSSMGMNGLGLINNLDSATASTSIDMAQNIGSQVSQSELEKSNLVQDNVKTSEGHTTGKETFVSSAKGSNEDIPSRLNLL